MRSIWLVSRLFLSTFGAGWVLALGCLLLSAQLQGGYLSLFWLWLAIGFARWYYALAANSPAFAYLHNLLQGRTALWAVVCTLELLPWLLAMPISALYHAIPG